MMKGLPGKVCLELRKDPTRAAEALERGGEPPPPIRVSKVQAGIVLGRIFYGTEDGKRRATVQVPIM
jgi:hypothetical protein